MQCSDSNAISLIQQAIASTQLKEILALEPTKTSTPLKSNSHIHLPPNFSAFETVSQAISLAASESIRVLGASNYYDFYVYDQFAQEAKAQHVFPLFGIEIIAFDETMAAKNIKLNDPGNPGKVYLCGKGITKFSPLSSKAEEILSRIREVDAQRSRKIISLLNSVFYNSGVPTNLSEEAVIDTVVRRHGCARSSVYLQERHICLAFQEHFFNLVNFENRPLLLSSIFGSTFTGDPNDAVLVQNEIRNQLLKKGKPAYVEERFVSIADARTLILELGGIPCYPVLADGAQPLSTFEETPEILISNLSALGIHCAEFIPPRNEQTLLTEYVTKLKQQEIIVTAGTEHNSLQLDKLTPLCKQQKPLTPEVENIFWEGSCVVAAHQYLCANNKCGYTDNHGLLNSAYANAEQRVTTFKTTGETVISSFCNS